jgi:voltage-gated potassium channel
MIQTTGKTENELTRQSSRKVLGNYDSSDLLKCLTDWLDDEVRNRFRTIDDKLDTLCTELSIIGEGRRGRRKRRQRISRANLAIVEPDFQANPVRRFSGESVDSNDPEAFLRSRPICKIPSHISAMNSMNSERSTGDMEKTLTDKAREREAYKQQLQETLIRERGTFSFSIWRFLENPYSSFLASAYANFVPVFVIVSVFLSFIQTAKDSTFEGPLANNLQIFCEVLYASELFIRFLVCPDRWGFWFSIFNWIDLVSALPIVIRLVVNSDEYKDNDHAADHWASAILLTLPLVRLLKIVRRFEKFHLLLKAWGLASEALPVLFYTLMLIALCFSVFVYFVEPTSNIGSLPTSMWFIVVTMTTVGYGDITPETTEGDIIVTILMIVSSLYMAIPIGIVGKAFSEVWGDRDRLLLMHRIRDAFLQEGYSGQAMYKIMNLFDDDGDGELAIDEFSIMLRYMNINMSDERVLMLHESIDKDGGGTINVGELINCLFPKAYTEFWRDMTDGLHISGVREGDMTKWVGDGVRFLKERSTTFLNRSSTNIGKNSSNGATGRSSGSGNTGRSSGVTNGRLTELEVADEGLRSLGALQVKQGQPEPAIAQYVSASHELSRFMAVSPDVPVIGNHGAEATPHHQQVSASAEANVGHNVSFSDTDDTFPIGG